MLKFTALLVIHSSLRMWSISNDVLVKLLVELLKYLIILAAITAYKQWWPRLKDFATRSWPGTQWRLSKLEKLIARYENFTHIEEMESQSKIHRSFANAFRMTIVILVISLHC